MKNDTTTSCRHQIYPAKKSEHGKKDRHRFTFNYFLYDWHERVAGVSWHDTDVLVGTSDDGNTLAIAFAGTSSASDGITNMQTFEPSNHSSFFFEGANNRTVQGSLHRGILNAYTRVNRGRALRLSHNCTSNASGATSFKARTRNKVKQLPITTTTTNQTYRGGCRSTNQKMSGRRARADAIPEERSWSRSFENWQQKRSGPGRPYTLPAIHSGGDCRRS